MQAALQVFYVGMAVYGWRAWRGSAVQGASRRQSLGAHGSMRWRGPPSPSSRWCNGWVITRGASSWVPYVDAAIAWGSVLTTWMVARKVLENWLYWIVLDSAAAVLAAWQGLAATALLFLLYTALALRGYWQWRSDVRVAAAHENMTIMRPDWQEAERAARAALAAHAETASLAVATFEPIAGSLSNFAWHVSAPGQDRFVRYARAGNEQLGADLHAEGEILRLVASGGARTASRALRPFGAAAGHAVDRQCEGRSRWPEAVIERSGKWRRCCAGCTT